MRIKNNDLYYKFNKNPFSIQNKSTKAHKLSLSPNRHMQSQNEGEKDIRSIFDVSSELQQKSKMENVIARLKPYAVTG